MDHLHIRCPSCAKLYQVETGRIFSSNPEFQCVSCSTRFSFDFPPADPLSVQTRVMISTVSAIKTKKCPRCAAETPESSVECSACGVIFEKLEGLPEDKSLKAQPSLVRRWKELLADYTNESLHQSFLMSCREQDALEYARMQYRELKRLQGDDEIADRMLARIEALDQVASAPEASVKESEALSGRALWFQRWATVKPFIVFVPYLVGFFLVLWGLSPRGQKNMIGAGMAVLLLSYGLLPEARKSIIAFFREKPKTR